MGIQFSGITVLYLDHFLFLTGQKTHFGETDLKPTSIERDAANTGKRLPRDLARACRALRVALLRAVQPDTSRLADRLIAESSRLIGEGRGAETVKARADVARVSVMPYRPDQTTPELDAAMHDLRAALSTARYITTRVKT